MSTQNAFKTLFQRWPDSVPRRGIIVNKLGDNCPFKGYMLSNDVILLERTAPDALGARFVMVNFEEIKAVKLVDPLGAEALNSLGFEGRLSQ